MIEAEIKQALYNHCMKYIDGKIQLLENDLASIKEALTNDHKSSVGDKHETSRAMAQLEQEKLAAQLLEVEKQKHILTKINPTNTTIQISVGSLVHTSQGNYFISISAGKTEIEDKTYFMISAFSPIGKALINSNQKEFIFNNQQISILQLS